MENTKNSITQCMEWIWQNVNTIRITDPGQIEILIEEHQKPSSDKEGGKNHILNNDIWFQCLVHTTSLNNKKNEKENFFFNRTWEKFHSIFFSIFAWSIRNVLLSMAHVTPCDACAPHTQNHYVYLLWNCGWKVFSFSRSSGLRIHTIETGITATNKKQQRRIPKKNFINEKKNHMASKWFYCGLAAVVTCNINFIIDFFVRGTSLWSILFYDGTAFHHTICFELKF